MVNKRKNVRFLMKDLTSPISLTCVDGIISSGRNVVATPKSSGSRGFGENGNNGASGSAEFGGEKGACGSTVAVAAAVDFGCDGYFGISGGRGNRGSEGTNSVVGELGGCDGNGYSGGDGEGGDNIFWTRILVYAINTKSASMGIQLYPALAGFLARHK